MHEERWQMWRRRWFLLVMIALMLSGCGRETVVPSRTSSQEATRAPTESAVPAPIEPAEGSSTAPVSAPPTAGTRPPARFERATPTPGETARADLAHRLNADVKLVDIVDVVSRAPEPDGMPCLRDRSIPHEIWSHASEVIWITLSVKGNRYHYLALGDVVVSCD